MLGMDVGGFSILWVVRKNNKTVEKGREIWKEMSREFLLKKIGEIILTTGEKKVGIGIPGLVKEGRIVHSPNLSFLNNLSLKRVLERKFRVKVLIENDANCFAFGEYQRWKKDLIGITLGTGVGGGIILNGKIYRGRAFAGEIGHMSIKAGGRRCRCGNRGCLEEYVSIRAFERESLKLFKRKLSPLQIFELASCKNKKAIQIFEKVGRFLGVGLANLANIFDPQLIVIGGGISKAGKFLINPAKEEMKKRCVHEVPKVVLGKEESGAVGASLLVNDF